MLFCVLHPPRHAPTPPSLPRLQVMKASLSDNNLSAAAGSANSVSPVSVLSPTGVGRTASGCHDTLAATCCGTSIESAATAEAAAAGPPAELPGRSALGGGSSAARPILAAAGGRRGLGRCTHGSSDALHLLSASAQDRELSDEVANSRHPLGRRTRGSSDALHLLSGSFQEAVSMGDHASAGSNSRESGGEALSFGGGEAVFGDGAFSNCGGGGSSELKHVAAYDQQQQQQTWPAWQAEAGQPRRRGLFVDVPPTGFRGPGGAPAASLPNPGRAEGAPLGTAPLPGLFPGAAGGSAPLWSDHINGPQVARSSEPLGGGSPLAAVYYSGIRPSSLQGRPRRRGRRGLIPPQPRNSSIS